MTIEQEEGHTPLGGTRTVTVYIDLETGAEADKAEATGAIVSEYDADGRWLGESVLRIAAAEGSPGEGREAP